MPPEHDLNILGIAGGLLIAAFVLLLLAIAIALFVRLVRWVARDADALGQPGLLWGLLTVLLFPWALLAWLIVRALISRREIVVASH